MVSTVYILYYSRTLNKDMKMRKNSRRYSAVCMFIDICKNGEFNFPWKIKISAFCVNIVNRTTSSQLIVSLL